VELFTHGSLSTYMTNQLSDHSIPRAVIFLRSVLVVFDRPNGIGKVTKLSNFFRQVDAKPLILFDLLAVFVICYFLN